MFQFISCKVCCTCSVPPDPFHDPLSRSRGRITERQSFSSHHNFLHILISSICSHFQIVFSAMPMQCQIIPQTSSRPDSDVWALLMSWQSPFGARLALIRKYLPYFLYGRRNGFLVRRLKSPGDSEQREIKAFESVCGRLDGWGTSQIMELWTSH